MADDNDRMAVYLSHSWRSRDVELNLLAWAELEKFCELLVDVPDEPGADPPYYLNRIEELLRRTDLFVSVLTYRKVQEDPFTPDDAYLHCSAYSLTEIRLAESSDLPRLILYENSTGFRPPRNVRPWEAYIPFDRQRNENLPEQRQWRNVIRPKIEQWNAWIIGHRRPISYDRSKTAALLVDCAQLKGTCEILEKCLIDNGYDLVQRCDPGHQGSSQAFRVLRESGLVVAEFASRDPAFAELYAAAHGMGLPSIRTFHSETSQIELPWILRGDPRGHQKNIVIWQKSEDLPPQVSPRIMAMSRVSPALPDDKASDYLQSKRYAQFFVFISHTLKGSDRRLVEEIYRLLKERKVNPFEYHEVNTVGVDWQKALDVWLQKTTHFVALLSNDYEQSPTCKYELDAVLERGGNVEILPFMLPGRDKPNPDVRQIHNKLISSDDAKANATLVVEQVMERLNLALTRSERD